MRLVEAMQAFQNGRQYQRCASSLRRICEKALDGRQRLLCCSQHHQKKGNACGDLDREPLEPLPVLQRGKGFVELYEIVTTLREGPTGRGIGRRNTHGVTQRKIRCSVITTLHLQQAQVVQQCCRWRSELQRTFECRHGLRVSLGRAEGGGEILPMSGNRRLHQRERIENSHRVLVPPFRMEDLPEHLQRAWMMVVCSEHLQALRLPGCKLVACQILPRQPQQQFGIGWGRHLKRPRSP